MAIYAFDGTWQNDDDLEVIDLDDTNVARFLTCLGLPADQEEYVAGVGTRHSILGQTIGGSIGAGAKSRIREMFKQLRENFRQGDEEIDIIGFSRGAALAVHFANEVNEKTLKDKHGKNVASPPVRFLGVWDVVGAFGIPINFILPFQKINPGINLTVPPNVQHCFHAMAMNERRESFMLTRLNIGNADPRIEERWFRGVHSDVGGGNKNLRLSNIALKWMLGKAADCGLQIRASELAKLEGTMDATAPISTNMDPLPDPDRLFQEGDLFHHTAKARELNVGESHKFLIGAGEKYSWTGVRLTPGGRYTFAFDPGKTWIDKDIECGPEGWTVEQQAEQLPFYLEVPIRFAERWRRHPEANWMEVIGTLGRSDEGCFRIGNGAHASTPFVAPREVNLYAFANDLESRYDNNSGELCVTVKRH